MIDPDTGLNYCKKHGWEQTKECVYCELDAYRAAVKELVEAFNEYRGKDSKCGCKLCKAIAAVERLEG